MIKKILTPIVYATFIIPLFVVMIMILSEIENTVGFLLNMRGFIEFPLIIILLGGVLFWLANKLIFAFEHLTKTTILDHLRQSSIYYLITFFSVASVLKTGLNGGIAEGLTFSFAIMSIWAIIINATFLYKSRK
ncbi:hypothetical protein CO057_00180 [Candidatus Uhrbacteria bacterium CG_4_9_14_0_2_um_filter_41_50]|uniref:Uncharacterized protein n=1 Tax=Candidatus Uhrbacteria bacterium CG_4_9_14_0_2_um_filter_41_50 TaxID=1975031 RepID=A0A2M8EQE3_9BACT|nr:MAG: hypothetical protein COZ45_03325 [Candidatus Uhrbacteria bacterium CG_4_10_14_3_um_filter_41_21]PIZ55485.1 MAG: hypothetical protein COY24_00085 [Candidatus Uhrbacteria bacterium CG_4_10_14_0_2_um_filter_41_21]PJB84689.1 MAG: hypothetical protein CO086_02255 [Candidatus Uhrbacteria bacterium CG_4_9_14_0_8_um_filter_41_16]PJC24954.1 MAG: hypothetical protein CO057_00180 [Candidatus Uhrbacteria bacterium CG_4_9_14_0_2_um_filter_41_50]PJE74690.1 MAG: hypothetical protein COV03_04190 [Candi